MRTFSTLKQCYNKHYIHLYNHQINSVQLQICLGNFKNEPQKWTYLNLYKFKYLGSAFTIECNSSAFPFDCNSSISFCDYFILHKTVSFLPLFYSKISLDYFFYLGICLELLRVYLLNASIKAYLLYGEKIQCNTGANIVSL